MRQHTIDLFMWGYQPHYRATLEYLAKDVFKQLGAETPLKVLLVGALDPSKHNYNPVCIEPENNQWSLSLFTNLLDLIETTVDTHPLQKMFYSDEQSMRNKPDVIRKDSVAKSVQELLIPFDKQNKVRSFCSGSYVVGDYYVVPIIQIPESIFRKYPPLKDAAAKKSDDFYTFTGHRSFIHACISTLLSEAIDALHYPEPGGSQMGNMRTANEIIRIAANNFMHTPGAVTTKQYVSANLFEYFNLISSLMYEGVEGKGQLLLVKPDNNNINYTLQFLTPISFGKPRWSRKILQMATSDIALIADSRCIYGLGRLHDNYDHSKQDVFSVQFIDHYHWELRCDNHIMLRSHYGEPKLPQEHISRSQFISNFERIFPESSSEDHERVWKLFNSAIRLKHGSMIVVATDAKEEALRLKQQGTCIAPTLMTTELLSRVSGIDGTIILDPQGNCYAVGIILDGEATNDCTPSRGSRYNSAIRYVNFSSSTRLAIVISDDHTIDIIPMLKPQIKNSDIELNISNLKHATLDNYHQPRNWLDKHRFYLNHEQCDKVNSALDIIESLPKDVGEFVIQTNRFKPDLDMNQSYLK